MSLQQITIVGFSGSVRAESHNKAALRLAQELLPANATLEILDIEHLSTEEAISAFNEKLARADALFIATPEYKGLLSRVLKNALSHVAPEVLVGKPTALVGIGRSNGEVGEHELLRALLAKHHVALLDEHVYVTPDQLSESATYERFRAIVGTLVERVEANATVLVR